MKKHLPITLFIMITGAMLAFPRALFAQEIESNPIGIISVPLANVHEQPVPKSALVTQVLMGDEIRVLEKKDYRLHIVILSQNNREGWIQQEAVYIPKDNGRRYLSSDRPWIVVAVPKTEALILDKTGDHKVPLYAGTRLPVLEKRTDSFKVQFPDRSIAIIDAPDALSLKPWDPIANGTSPEEIAKTARKFVGVRYLAGGLSAQGMDMRGLIYIVYRIHSYPIGRERSWLGDGAERINKKELQSGDIVFFNGESEGLYLGNGRFLHSARKSSVRMAGLHDRRYARSFRFGVRLIGAGPGRNKTLAQMTADDILLIQSRIAALPLGKRISYWAARFIGTPYDPDPLGLYVRTSRIVADEKVDCMYHVFRSVELAEADTPRGAIEKALSLRFTTEGKLADGLVTNYDQRFEYGEDMVFSGKWGNNITEELGRTRSLPGTRGRETVNVLPKNILATRALQRKLRDGDIVYWVKDPKKRASDEIVGHLSIIRIRSGKPYVIHAAGNKDHNGAPGGGVVKEVPFSEYVHNMHFVGAFITRFER